MDQHFHGNVVSPHIRHRTELHKKWTQHLVSLLKMHFKIPCRPKCKISASVFNHFRSLHVWRGLGPFNFALFKHSMVSLSLSLSIGLGSLPSHRDALYSRTMVCPVVFNQFSALYSCRQCYHCSNTNMSTGWAARNVSTAPPHPHPSCAAEKVMLRKAAFHAYGFRELGREHHQNDQTMRDSMMILNVMPGSLNWPSWGLSIKTATHHFTSSVITRHNCMTQIQVSGLRFCLHHLCKHIFFASRILLCKYPSASLVRWTHHQFPSAKPRITPWTQTLSFSIWEHLTWHGEVGERDATKGLLL